MKLWMAVIALVSGLCIVGCAAQKGFINMNVVLAKQPVVPGVPGVVQVPDKFTSEQTVTPINDLNMNHVKAYMVKAGDCLWSIAAKSSVYDDPFLWPVIFKDNHDQIKDQDLIYPHQTFVIRTNLKEEDQDAVAATKIADNTPKYKAHK